MPFHKKTTLLCTILAAVVLSPLAVSSVENLKTTGSAKGYDLVEDNISSSQNNPGFITNSLGSDNYSPRISLNGTRGKPAAIDLTNGTGAPRINLYRTSGYNSNISGLSSSQKASFTEYSSGGESTAVKTITMKPTSTWICTLNKVTGFYGRGLKGTVAQVYQSGGYWRLRSGRASCGGCSVSASAICFTR